MISKLINMFQQKGNRQDLHSLVPIGSKERGVFGIGSIPVAILPFFQDMKSSALYLHKH